MVETFKLLLHFVAASTPVPPGPGPEPTPTPGGGGTSVASQTGDINLLLFFAVLFVAIAAVLMLFLAARAKAQGTNMKSVAVNYAFKFATNARLAVIGALVVAAIALLCGITLANAFATSNEDASNTVNVYVNEETGVITSIDQGTYTNETGHNIAVSDIATSIAEEAQSVTGLENATLTIKNGSEIFYQGKIGTSYMPTTTTYVADGQTLTFTFEFKDLAADTALQLIDKDAVGLSFNEKGYHTITYDGNGNTGGSAPDPFIKIDDTTAKISGNTGSLVKGEATFNGWNTNAEGTGTPYVEGQNYTDNEDLKLFAVYKEPTTDVTLTYKIIDEYQDMSHGSVALTSGGSAAWQVTESFNPDSASPVGAKATPKDTEENDAFGNWEFSHWSIVKDGEEVCVSESAQFVPTLETLGLTTWADTTITAHFGKAVALFDPNAETLTFKYTEDEDVLAESWALPVYKDAYIDIAKQEFKLPSWFTADGTLKCYPRTAIIEKDFKHFKGITSMDMWFASSKTLASLFEIQTPANIEDRKLDKIEGLENIDTSEVVSTVAMFADNCSKNVKMTSGNSNEKYGSGKYSFNAIDLSSWVTPKLKDTSYMFTDCWNLQQILLPTDQTTVEGSFGRTVENMESMFSFCGNLKTLNISSTFGENAKTTKEMFNYCLSLKTIDAPAGNKFLSSCENCYFMFYWCQSLQRIDISNLKVDSNTGGENIYWAFQGCKELRYVTVGAGTTWTNTELSLGTMGLRSNEYVNGWYATDDNSEEPMEAGSIPAAHITEQKTITYRTLCSKAIYNDAANAKSLTFYYDHKVYNTIEFSLDTALNTKYMKQDTGGDIEEMYNKPIFPEWYSYTATADGANVSTSQILGEYDSATLIPNLDLKITLTIDAVDVYFDTSFKNCPDLYSMAYFFMADSTGKQTFKNFHNWENVNTQNIRSYACMFGGFSYRSIAQNPNDDLAFKISNVPPLDKLPYYNAYANDTYGTALESIDISRLNIFPEYSNKGDTAPPLNFDFMFANCTKLQNVTFPTLPVNAKDTMERWTRFNHTFENCQSLTSVPDTLKESYYISYAQYMFWNCTNLKTADLEGWRVNTSKDWDDYGYNMFSGCNNLITVKTDENWCWKMNICGLIETWPDGIEPTNFNPWIWSKEGQSISMHVWEIPFDDYYQPTHHGTFTRDENNKGMAQANISSADTTQGTVSPGTVNFVGTVIVIPLADGNIKVGDTVVKVTPADGYEVAYWTCNGKKIIDVDINSKLPQLNANDDSPKNLQVHFRKANYRPKAVYNETSKTMTMYYDDQTHAGEGRVFDINPNTYLQPSLGHGKVPAFHPEVLLSNSENGQSNADSNNIYTGYWDYTEFEISLPSWYEFRQDNENQRFYINSLVAPETVVFDSTFADYDELQSISMWFMADSDNDQTIKTFKSVDSNGNELAPFANLNTTSIQNVEYAFGGLYLNRYFNSSGAAAAASAADFLFDTLLGDPASAVTYNSSYNTYGNSIKELDMSGFDFSKLRSMDWMFANCQGVEKIKFDDNFDTSYLNSMEGVFNNCENCEDIIGLAGSKVNTINVDNMDNLFQGCSHIESLDLSKFDTRNVYKNEEMWFIVVTTNGRSNFTHNKMFLDCVRLNEIKITSNFNEGEDEWTGWTLYMDMCDLPSSLYPEENWQVNGEGDYYTPHFIPLTISENRPTKQTDLIQGTITRNRPSIYTVNVKTGDATKGQIAYLNNTQEQWQYDYINSINISTIQDAEQAAAPADAKFSNETAQASALYVDDRTYFAVPENGYELLNWTATWKDSSGNDQTRVLNDQGSLYLDGDNKANITVTASFKEKGAEAWALLSEDSNGNGYFSFRYDKNVYAPDTQLEITLNGAKVADTTVIKAYTVSYNHDDYNFPLWYDDSSIWAYYDCDKHSYIPGFDNEFSKYSIGNNPLTIVFEDNFKNFDTLESLSCFFMQAPKASDGFFSLVTPFAFDSDHFKGLSNICMDHVWNVKYMFGGHEYFNDINGSKAFETIDLTGLDMSKLNNLDAMFANCLNLKSITWPEGFDCSKITSMYKTFFNCDSLYGNDLLNVLDGLNTSNVTDMSYMFAKRHFHNEEQRLQNEAIDIDYIFPSTFTVASVTNMTRMFAGNEFAKSINIKTQTTLFELFASEQDNANALTVDATGMFEGCSYLETLTADSSSWFGKISIKTAVNMFAYCYALTNAVPALLGGTTFPDFSACTDMYGMFQSCSNMTEFVPSTKTKRFTTTSLIYMNYMFADSGLENFVVGKSGSPRSFDTSNVVEFVGMFYNCNNLQKVDLARDKLANTKLIVDAEDMFRYCSNITDLTLKSFIFDSDENFNKNRYVPRTFLWDNDRESVIGISQQWGTFHPYSNMFANISTTGSIQSFEIDGKWNGNLGDVSRMQQSDNSFPALKDDYSCGFPKSYYAEDLYGNYRAIPILWRLDLNNSHIIGEAGEITKYDSYEGTVTLPFGGHRFERVIDDNDDTYNKFIHFLPNNSQIGVSITSPDIALPPSFSMKFIDLTDCTSLSYQMWERRSENDVDYDMILYVTYRDGNYQYKVTADSYGMTYRQKGVTYITKWFMCDDYYDTEFTRLSYEGGSIDLSVLEDPYYLLAFRGIIDIDDRTVNDLNNNDNANVPDVNGDADAVASADDAAQAQAPAAEGEDLAADEVSNSDDLLAKADDLLQEVKDVCMWIFFLFVV